jgi:hypothetical protein
MSPKDGRSGCILFFYFQMEKKSFKKDYMLRFLGTNQRYIYAIIDFFLDSKSLSSHLIIYHQACINK